ncbi:MAG: isoprenyl transferase [Ferruginibacter sp.]|nr:isoprenyl transferase [Ferruginibacter sp.]
MGDMERINLEQLPRHIAIIMDGNGRWAEEKGHDRLYGHFKGVESVRAVVEAAAELGIKHLTLYAFSTENWERPEEEVTGLMTLLVDTIKKEVPVLNKNNIKLHVIGDTNMLPDKVQKELKKAIADTAQNTGLNLIMALSYSARWELVEAAKRLATEVKKGKIIPEEINQSLFSAYLTTEQFPDPELLIRTGGEQRISNFLLFQIAYAELYFTQLRWPDFGKNDLYDAVVDYQARQRRFGKTGKQVTHGAPGNQHS